MNLCSFPFLSACALAAVVFQFLPRRLLRQLLLSACNIAFLAAIVPNWQSWLGFAVFIVGSFGAVKLAKSRPSVILTLLTLVLTVAAFVYVKKYAFLQAIIPPSAFAESVELIGLSYMLFKFIHVFVDQSQGQLAPCSFFTYANYQLAFFSLLAGPIQRFNEFQRFWEQMDFGPPESNQARDGLLAWSRILTGAVKMGAIAVALGAAIERADGPPTNKVLLRLLVLFYAYPLYLYFNFSGYTDMVIGCARLFGFRLPENFNWPFLSRNMLEFWNRWHITLTHWIRDYVFMTSYKALVERFPGWAKYFGYLLIFFALFIAGVWHGTTGGFAIFGALQGLGAAVSQIYGDALKARLGRPRFHAYLQNRWIHALAVVVTFHFFAFSLLFFAGSFEREIEFVRALSDHQLWLAEIRGLASHRAAAPAAVCLATLAGAAWWKQRSLVACYEAARRRASGSVGLLYLTVFVQAMAVIVMFWALFVIDQKDPVVVYMRF